MNISRHILVGLLLLILVNCSRTNKSNEKPLNIETQTLITEFSKSIFSRERIISKEILDTLNILSDTIFADTAKYYRTPKAIIYANNAARTYFQVIEDPKGTINLIAFFNNNIEMNVAEYFDNGQVMCKFNVTDEGVRDGRYFCYYENGKYRRTGYYKKGKEINDSLRSYKDE